LAYTIACHMLARQLKVPSDCLTLARVTSDATDPARQIRDQIRQLQDEDSRLAESLRDTRAARHRIAAQIRSLEANLKLLEQLAGPAAERNLAEIQGGTIADAAAAILARLGGAGTMTQLVAELQEAGKLLRSPGAYPTLMKALTRDQRFERVPDQRGQWRLVTRKAR